MKTINLRVLYPDAYKSDYYVEVPDEVADVFETFERMEKAYIFGSVARGEQTENSDVDVCVEGQLHGFFALAGIKQELEELLGCKVDIVRLRDRMDSFLRERIQREGIYV